MRADINNKKTIYKIDKIIFYVFLRFFTFYNVKRYTLKLVC